MSEEVKELPEHSRLGLAISGSLQRGSADTTTSSDSTNTESLFLPGVTPPWTVLQPAPHLTIRMEWPLPSPYPGLITRTVSETLV